MTVDQIMRDNAASTTIVDRPRTAVLEGNEYRIDGCEKVNGQAEYAADFALPGMLWAAFATSPLPHAKIVSVDTSAALAMHGVHAVLTGADLGKRFFGRKLLDWPVLAVDRVRFIGDYVATVAAETPEIAAAAAAAIEIEYEELPAFFDPEEALAPGATILHEHPEDYPFLAPPAKREPVPHPNVQGCEKIVKGDVDAALAQADRVFEETYTTPRYFPGYIEPRAAVVWIDDDGTVHVISTNKSPFHLRNQMALTTGLPAAKIVVEPCFIGGDFGGKGLSVDEFHCYYLAVATNRPVKHVRAYLDDIQGTSIRHASKTTFRTGVAKDGKIVAIDVRVVYNGGAYSAAKTSGHLLPGPHFHTPYNIPHARVERLTVYTNTVPGGFVRCAGEMQTLFAVESHVDAIARAMGIDPLEFRRRNAMHEGDADLDGLPHHDANGLAVLDSLSARVDWNRTREPWRGHGIAFHARHIGGGKTQVLLGLLPDGTVDVRTGCTEVGVGLLTMTQRVVAQTLGIDPVQVRVRRGSTAEVPFDPGVGAGRSTHIVGRAAEDAASQLRRALEAIGFPQRSWTDATAELLRAGPFDVTGSYDDGHRAGIDPSWTNMALTYVDLSIDPDTGALTLHDVLCIIDAGTIINPIAFRGQLEGGFAMGLGHALTEELCLDGGKIVNLNLGEYKLPTQTDMPPFRIAQVEAARGPGPFGAKMVSELSTSSVAPAIANAVADAIGVRVSTLPITAERVYDAIATLPRKHLPHTA